MSTAFLDHIAGTLASIEADGLYKREREITSPQAGRIDVKLDGRARHGVINLCANNYLGLAEDAALIDAAKNAMDSHGFGMASVRFICGTQDLHRALEARIARFLRKDDAILFAACFDANGGLFEPLLGPEDAIVSDALNHASIIDGIRLCKAKRYRLRELGHGRPGAAVEDGPGGGRALHHDRDRRGLLHGRLSGQAAGDHGIGEAVRGFRDGR